jgi:hypothetical protein
LFRRIQPCRWILEEDILSPTPEFFSLGLIVVFNSSHGLLFILSTLKLVFHPPYSKVTAAFGVITVVSLGYGAMYMGMRHQQYKQGYWKK